jgi:hypothetical protein
MKPDMRKKFVVGIWKMYTAIDARRLAKAIVDGLGREDRVSVAVCTVAIPIMGMAKGSLPAERRTPALGRIDERRKGDSASCRIG